MSDSVNAICGLRRLRSGKKRKRMAYNGGNERCAECGYRIRGKDHASGPHHARGKKRV